MSLMDFPFKRYPRTWREMSYDFKLLFLYHASMMLLLIAGDALSVAAELIIVSVLLVAATLLAIRHRRTTPWVWSGLSRSRLLGAAAGVILGGLFLLAAAPLFPPSNPRALPWFLAGLGIIIFGTLERLRLVALSESDYFTPPAPSRISERPWKNVLRVAYSALFFAVWLTGVASFYYFGITFREGARLPTSVHTEPLSNHGQVVYITADQKRRVDALQIGTAVGIPCVLLLGAILHFIVGVRLIPNAPTREEWKRRRQHPPG